MSTSTENKEIWKENEQPEELDPEIMRSSTDEIAQRIRLLENDIKVRILPPRVR
jgi:hypothetical protein